MTHLKIRNHCQGGITLIDNGFIDHYMIEANGEYVKAYLLLLRFGVGQTDLTIAAIADCLECTERDVMRAFKYWEKCGLLGIEYDQNGDLCGLSIARIPAQPDTYYEPEEADILSAAPVAGDSNPDVTDMQSYRNRKDFAELTYVAECYLGKTLSKTEADIIYYCLDDLHLSVDLVEYLIEYSVDSGHKSFRYMKAIARSWAEKGITTIEEAKADSDAHSAFAGKCSRILKAYGIAGRSAGDAEKEYIRTWIEQFHMPMDVILEACKRTLDSVHQPAFAHTNKILSDWNAKNILSLEDVERLDPKRPGRSVKKARTSDFNNAPSRSYDMADLERKLLKSN